MARHEGSPRVARQVRTGRMATWRRTAIETMERSRRSTLRFLEKLPESEILRPGTQGKWSLKDVLAHIVAWEEEAVKRFGQIARGQAERIVFYDDMRAADRFNARAVARARRLAWPSLLRRAAQVRRRLITEFRHLPPSALNDGSHRYPVVAWLPEFAWTHEREHLRRIRAWWGKRSGHTSRPKRSAG